jgi:hypothetical protein
MKQHSKIAVLTLVLLLAASAAFAQRGGSLGGSSTPAPAPTPQNYTLQIQVNVNGAQIFINNSLQSSNIVSLAEGNYVVRVTAPGYQEFVQQIRMNGNQRLNVNLTPETYTLTVNTNVGGARVFINNALQNGNRAVLPVGRYTIRVTAPGYQEFIQVVNLNQNQTIPVSLIPQFGYLDFDIPDDLRTFTVTVDGETYRQNQLDSPLALMPGSYIVRMDISGLVGLVEVELEAAEEVTLRPLLSFQVLD